MNLNKILREELVVKDQIDRSVLEEAKNLIESKLHIDSKGRAIYMPESLKAEVVFKITGENTFSIDLYSTDLGSSVNYVGAGEVVVSLVNGKVALSPEIDFASGLKMSRKSKLKKHFIASKEANAVNMELYDALKKVSEDIVPPELLDKVKGAINLHSKYTFLFARTLRHTEDVKEHLAAEDKL